MRQGKAALACMQIAAFTSKLQAAHSKQAKAASAWSESIGQALPGEKELLDITQSVHAEYEREVRITREQAAQRTETACLRTGAINDGKDPLNSLPATKWLPASRDGSYSSLPKRARAKGLFVWAIRTTMYR